MKKLSAKCILCISYILEGNISGKLFDMKIVKGARCSRRCHWTLAESGGVNCFSPGINNRDTTIWAAKEKLSWGKSCAENALDGFNALIALFRMSNAGEFFNGHWTHCSVVGGMTTAKTGCCHRILVPSPIAVVKPNKAFCSENELCLLNAS
jgi:hypothetical protein